MNVEGRREWIRAALLVGVFYLVIGRLFAVPATHVQAWRLAAWGVCGVAYAAHIGFEHFALRSSPRMTAFHVAVGVATGGFALAVAGMLHSLTTDSALNPSWLLALVLFPGFTGIPAFVGAFVAAIVLSRGQRN